VAALGGGTKTTPESGRPCVQIQPREMGALATQAAARSALEMIIAGMIGALVKSKAVKANVLEDHVLVP
jgi:hypothetical protein